MTHIISISTVDALVLNKALRNDMGNETDNELAKKLTENINKVVEKDLNRKQKQTNLENKCASCKWAKAKKHYSCIDCVHPEKINQRLSHARSRRACGKYERRELEDGKDNNT